MTDPFAYLPFAIAAREGSVDTIGAASAVMAGVALLRQSAPLVRALEGRRSAILLPSSPGFLVALAASAGRAAVLINPAAAPREIAFQLEDAGVGAVFTSSTLASRLPDAMPRVLLDDAPTCATVVSGGTERVIALAGHDSLGLEGAADEPGADEPCAIVYTSAMRGVPLGAILTHRNLLHNAHATVEAQGLAADDHLLAALPWAHLFGLTVTATAPLLAGARVSTMPRFNPVRAVELLEQASITQFVGVPAMYAAILQVLARRGTRLQAPALRVAICGGSTLPRAWQDQWADATGIELRQGYGLTEAGPVCLYNRVRDANVRGTLGRPFPGVAISVRSPLSHLDEPSRVPLTEALSEGAEGELCVRGENVSPGYLHDGDHGLPRREGWLYTGDRARINADGTVSFLGLYKAMFLRMGYNVYPREIERAMCELAGVARATVLPLAEPTREHDIAVDITGTVSEGEVVAWCEARLSAYKQPSVVRITA